jgi:hypothetical protein
MRARANGGQSEIGGMFRSGRSAARPISTVRRYFLKSGALPDFAAGLRAGSALVALGCTGAIAGSGFAMRERPSRFGRMILDTVTPCA